MPIYRAYFSNCVTAKLSHLNGLKGMLVTSRTNAATSFQEHLRKAKAYQLMMVMSTHNLCPDLKISRY
jgi:hypothetical protein